MQSLFLFPKGFIHLLCSFCEFAGKNIGLFCRTGKMPPDFCVQVKVLYLGCSRDFFYIFLYKTHLDWFMGYFLLGLCICHSCICVCEFYS